MKELEIGKNIIQNTEIPLRWYNYSFVKDRLERKYNQRVSLPTIVDRAKKNGYYLKKPKRTIHEREVLTNYVGELIQHDSSYHLWSPCVHEKCLPVADRLPSLMIIAGLSSTGPGQEGNKLVSHYGPAVSFSLLWASLFLIMLIPAQSCDLFRGYRSIIFS